MQTFVILISVAVLTLKNSSTNWARIK